MTIREWTHVERSALAFHATRGPTSQYVVSTKASEHGVPVEIDTTIRFWGDGEGRFREERENFTMVGDSVCVWSWSPELGAVVHEQHGPMETSTYELLNPVSICATFDLEVLGPGSSAGRAATRVRVVPRSEAARMHSLGMGADEIQLAVDGERGVLLRVEARFEREPFRLLEVTDVAFDETLPPETFVFVPPPGEEVKTFEEAYRFEYVQVEELAARASFTVWVPSGLDARWRVLAIHRPANERARTPESAHLLFHDDALHNFSVEEAAERLLAWRTDEPRVESVGGVEVRVLDGSRPGPPTEVHLERGGTHVRISSDTLDAERLVAVAGSLVQASSEAPPIF
jgi:outer membrane lipoprotein-sorting protein